MIQHQGAVELLDFLSTPEWIANVRSSGRAERIPAGVTYLSQLMAHDMFMTEPQRNVFRSGASKPTTCGSVNLVQAPLLLDTIYGRAGSANLPLYSESQPNKFDLLNFVYKNTEIFDLKLHSDPNFRWSQPVLADARNYSTPILAQISFEFMAFHNRLVDAYTNIGAPQAMVFSSARANVIRTWHEIIKNDIIEFTCRKPASMPKSMWDTGFFTDSEYLSLGVLRCFHALVRENYFLNEVTENSGSPFDIKTLLKSDFRGPDVGSKKTHSIHKDQLRKIVLKWRLRWSIDWERFFTPSNKDVDRINFTGFTPSFTFRRMDRLSNAKKPIQILDSRKLRNLDDRDLFEQTSIKNGVAALLEDMKEMGAKTNADLPTNVPLPIALLAEGFYEEDIKNGDIGKLGPVGSTIVRRQLQKALKKAKRQVDQISNGLIEDLNLPTPDNMPTTFLSMTKKADITFSRTRGN